MKNTFSKEEFELIYVCKTFITETDEEIIQKLFVWMEKEWLLGSGSITDLFELISNRVFKIWENKGADTWRMLEIFCKPYLGVGFSMVSFGSHRMTNWEKSYNGAEWTKEMIFSFVSYIRNTEVKYIPGYAEFHDAKKSS